MYTPFSQHKGLQIVIIIEYFIAIWLVTFYILSLDERKYFLCGIPSDLASLIKPMICYDGEDRPSSLTVAFCCQRTQFSYKRTQMFLKSAVMHRSERIQRAVRVA